MKIVEVTWLDAKHEFDPDGDAKDASGTIVQTVGYLLRRDKELTVIAMEATEMGYRNRTAIPALMVKHVRYIER